MGQFINLQNTVSELKSLMVDMRADIRANNPNIATGATQTLPRSTETTQNNNPAVTPMGSSTDSLTGVIQNHVQSLIDCNPTDTSLQGNKQGNYIALQRPLDLKVDVKIKDKIWSNQFVDLASLLDTRADGSQALRLVSVEGEPIRFTTQKPDSKINSLGKWTDAFMVFMTVYTRKYPHETAHLMAYMQLIKRLALKGGDFVYYDEEFRYLRQHGLQGWEVHTDLWLEARDIRGSQAGGNKPYGKGYNGKSNNNSFRGQSKTWNRSSHPKGYCFRYHSTGRCKNIPECTFKHTCYNHGCGGRHPVFSCNNKGAAPAQTKAPQTNTPK